MSRQLSVGCGYGVWQRGSQQLHLGVRATTDADTAVLWGDKRHANENTPLAQLIDDLAGKRGVMAAVNRDKIGGRRDRGQPAIQRDLGDLVARFLYR